MSKVTIGVCVKALHMYMLKIFIGYACCKIESPYPYEKEMNQDTANAISMRYQVTF